MDIGSVEVVVFEVFVEDEVCVGEGDFAALFDDGFEVACDG